MPVKYSVADTKLLSNDTAATEDTKIRVKLRQVLAKQKGPYEESALDIVQDIYNGFLKEHQEHMTEKLEESLFALYEKKVSAVKQYLERAKVKNFPGNVHLHVNAIINARSNSQ